MKGVPEPSPDLLKRAGAVRLAAAGLAQINDALRAQALQSMAEALEERSDAIVAAMCFDMK